MGPCNFTIGWNYGAGRLFSLSTSHSNEALQDINYERLVGNSNFRCS